MIVISIIAILAVVVYNIFLPSLGSRKESNQQTYSKKQSNNEVTKIKQTLNAEDELMEYLQKSFWPEFEAKAVLKDADFDLLMDDPIGYLSVSEEPYNFIAQKINVNKHFFKSHGSTQDGEFTFEDNYLHVFNKFYKSKNARPLFSYKDFYFDWTTIATKISTDSGTFHVAARINSNSGYAFSKPTFSADYRLSFDLSSSFAKSYPNTNFTSIFLPVNEATKIKLNLIKEVLIKYNKNVWTDAVLKLAKEAKNKAEVSTNNAKQVFVDHFINDKGEIILSPNVFQSLFTANKESINENYRDNISDLMKVKSFINTKELILRDIINAGLNTDDFTVVVDSLKALSDSLKFQDLLVASGVEFMQALFEDDIIKYHEIKELFDRLGVFNNTWQNDILGKLSQMNGKLENIEGGLLQLNTRIVQFEDRFIREVQQLQLISAKGLYAVTSGLEKLSGKMDTSNAIASVNAYQNYQTKRELKS